MNEGFENDAGRSQSANGHSSTSSSRANGQSNGHAARNGNAPVGGFDVWTIAEILTHRWHWLLVGAILGGAAFFSLGYFYLIKPKFTATAQLLRYDPPGGAEEITGPALTSETFSSLITAPELLRKIGSQLQPAIPPERLVKQIKVDPQPDSDLVKVLVAAADPTNAVHIANLYSEEAVAYTKQLQARRASELANTYLKQLIDEMDKDISNLQKEFREMALPAPVSNKLEEVTGNLEALNQNLLNGRASLLTQRLSEKLQLSMTELSELTSKYTDIHPLVQQKRDQIQQLQEQIASSVRSNDPLSIAASIGPGGQTTYDPNRDLTHGKIRAHEDARIGLLNRQREAALFASNPPGIVRVFAPANLKTVQGNHRKIKTGIVTIFGACVGMGLGLGLILLTEAFDRRLRTADDLKRVTRLPVLTTLGDLDSMPEKERTQWAFRSWTRLQGRLSRSQNHGLVCGITSSTEGEGRSTWIKLLSEAASLSGFRVLTIATRPSIGSPPQLTDEVPASEATPPPEDEMEPQENQVAAISNNVLATPAQVTEQLTDPNSQPVVHIPLPGWVWNLDRRREWRDALEQWRQIDNLVIFVELPPASVPEAVLLGSNLPNVIWLADSGTADASETRTQLQTLRDARCNLVGAVLNRDKNGSIKKLFPRWLGCVAVLAMSLSFGAHAQMTTLPVDAPPDEQAAAPTQVPRTNLTFSVTSPAHRAEWQQRLTLGPGDVLSFSLYGEPLLNRNEVVVQPDGRVSYLEAQDIVATGLTIDELRQKFDDELGKYRRVARTIITPVTFRSKKYFVLGKVVQRGVYTLDRPTTVIEAIARAKGLENGLVDNNTVDLADLSRSFLMRRGQRIELDFEKLFNQGDLSQNIQIEPNDYLYFPSGSVQEVYVLGEVGLPGLVVHRPDTTVLTAIANRGGFNEKAFKSRVLVIRGSLNNPETFVVDGLGALNGRNKDLKLQPRDIVYVSHRPFYKAEDLLDMATVAFIQAIVTSWVGTDILTPVE